MTSSGSYTYLLTWAAPSTWGWLLIAAAQLAGVSQGWGGIGLLLWPLAGHVLLVAARHHPATRRT